VRYIVVPEHTFLLYQLPDLTGRADEIVCLAQEDLPADGSPPFAGTVVRGDPTRAEAYRALEIQRDDRVILCTVTADMAEKMLDAVLSACAAVPVVVLGTEVRSGPRLHGHNISHVAAAGLVGKAIQKEWHHIRNRERTEQIRQLTRGAEAVLILTQHDPDPDALASGLALRTLLGRNRATAPLGSLGRVTRSENVNMIRHLDIQVNLLEPRSLGAYDMIALVDVQPPYFGDTLPRADIIVDHHPRVADYRCSFRDIREEYGATSTILSEYLIANGVTFTQRLATALLYGIKSDTLMLGREVHAADVEVFTSLYPLANHNLIRRIEYPSLNPEEVSSFARALTKHRLINRVAFTHLGRVRREDIIPRLADFCLQIDGAEWSVVSGVFERRVIISVRNAGYGKSAGEVVKKLFPDPETAGGHRTMAKVNITVGEFKKLFHLRSTAAMAEVIIDAFLSGMEEDAR
jgi:nanoRNase/pAp phosphatase (c-di-AMP/oligoRNAs hydrolase)